MPLELPAAVAGARPPAIWREWHSADEGEVVGPLRSMAPIIKQPPARSQDRRRELFPLREQNRVSIATSPPATRST